MFSIYIKRALKNKIILAPFIALLIASPLVLGAIYGVMYQSFFQTSIPSDVTDIASSGIVEVLHVGHILNGTAVMQLNLFTGMSFFLVSFFAASFVKNRSSKFTHRLIAMGYNKKHVFIGEGISYYLVGLIITTMFNVLFIQLHKIPFELTFAHVSQVFLIINIQALFAASYSLLAMGLFKQDNTFAKFHFMPGAILSFLGGAMFPIDQIASGGIYEFMPTYNLKQLYSSLYSLRGFDSELMLKSLLPLLVFSLIFMAIGYTKFSLKEAS